jgi:predicted MPP superfamily phosphohydrolase
MKITRRHFLQTMLALTGSAAAGAMYATKIEPHWVSYTRRTLPIRNLPPSLASSTLIHLSDLHIGDKFDYQYILDTFDDIGELAPDFVVYTGDFVSYQSRRQLEQFGEVAPRLPHWAVSAPPPSSATTITGTAGGSGRWRRCSLRS